MVPTESRRNLKSQRPSMRLLPQETLPDRTLDADESTDNLHQTKEVLSKVNTQPLYSILSECADKEISLYLTQVEQNKRRVRMMKLIEENMVKLPQTASSGVAGPLESRVDISALELPNQTTDTARDETTHPDQELGKMFEQVDLSFEQDPKEIEEIEKEREERLQWRKVANLSNFGCVKEDCEVDRLEKSMDVDPLATAELIGGLVINESGELLSRELCSVDSSMTLCDITNILEVIKL